MEMLRDIPGYKAALKAVLKAQIQFLAEQLSSETDEEMVILSASTVDGSLCQLGSQYGKNFLHNKDDIQSQFSQHCLQKKFETPTGKEIPGLTESEKVPDKAVTEPTAHPHIDESLTQDEIEAELSETFGANEGQDDGSVPVTAKPGTSKAHGRKKRKKKVHESSTKKAKTSFDLNEKSEREEIEQNDTVDHQAETSVESAMGDTNFDKTGDSKHEEMPFTITKINTADGTDDENKVKVEPESDNGSDIDSTGDRSDGQNKETIDENEALTSKGDKPPKLEVAEPVTGQKGNRFLISQLQSVKSGRKQKSTGEKVVKLPAVGILQPTDHVPREKPQSLTNASKGKLLHCCEYCGNVYSSRSGLKVHVDGKHKDKFRFRCEVCGKGHNSLWNFRGHLKMHFQKLREKCETCGKCFTYSSSLVTHKRKCGKTTVGASKTASITHYMCQICGANFHDKKGFKEHERGSHGDASYQCQICSRIFKWRSSLSYHMKHFHQK